MKLIVLLFTLLVWSNVRDVNKIQLDIKETKDPIVPPKTILIIGNTAELDSPHKRNTFDLYRSSLRNPEVVTFDELFERAKFIVGHSEESLNEISPTARAKHPAEAGYIAPSVEAEDDWPF
jgi:hypothetical protein